MFLITQGYLSDLVVTQGFGSVTPPPPVQEDEFPKRDRREREDRVPIGAGGHAMSYWQWDRENLAVLMIVMEAESIL